jgi:succinate dehydrogenase / fumarate reductase flavoprotein subunit
MELKANLPSGPLATAWERHRFDLKLVNPANKRRYQIIVVGSGLAGASAAASLGELGYNVRCFCYQDSPRRAHSIAAQGGINAAKNYQNDGDSVQRLFYDTIKGGDFRAREHNVYRLAEISNHIIDQCAAQGVPFAREYGGQLANRSFGGAQVSRTFYARGQTGQQLLLGGYQALSRQIATGQVKMFPRSEMLDLVVVDGRACGIVTRDMVSGAIEAHAADAVILATGGYSNGRVWVPLRSGDQRPPAQIPEPERDYYLERRYPSFGNLVPRDVASRAAKAVCDENRGVGPGGRGVYLDFSDAISRQGEAVVRERYGNLFDMYERITAENPYKVPMRIYPAVHYTMGGLWVDYDLMSTIPGLFVAGEANFSDHGANRLGASALMQGLADGYFIIPYAIGGYLAASKAGSVSTDKPEFGAAKAQVKERANRLLARKGKRTATSFHRELGKLLWENCGMARTAAGLKQALGRIPELREQFWREVMVPGGPEELNQSLETAGRVGDFLEFAELLCRDALLREESCGGHFRQEYQTPDGEALRDDEHFAHVAVWEHRGDGLEPLRHTEPLSFDNVHLAQRSYK